MARHKRSYHGERYTAALRVQVTPKQRKKLEDAAKQKGASNLSAYARDLLFRRSETVVAGSRRNPEAKALMDELARVGRELKAIGNNLNQIARHLNTTGDLRDWSDLRESLAAYQHNMDMHKLAVSRVLGL